MSASKLCRVDSGTAPGKALSRRRRPAALMRRLLTETRGSTAVEFGIVAMPFMVLLVVIIEVGLAFFAAQILDNAVADTARLIRTGQVKEAKMDQAGFKQAVLDRLPGFFSANRLAIDVRNFSSFAGVTVPNVIDEDGKVQENFTYNPGNSSQIVVVRAFYKWPMLGSYLGVDFADTADGDRLLGSIVAFRNEPFPF